MSLIVNANASSTIAPIPEGSYLAVCNMIVDLGMQFNEKFKSSSRKLLIGWEIPELKIEFNGKEQARTINNRYTASLNESSNLRKDLAAWRGRDFTPEELAAFDLHNIIGASCLINVIHREYNGKKYANISSIMALPKGMAKGQLSEPALVFDLDTASLDDIDDLPNWIGDIIKKSATYEEMLAADQQTGIEPPPMEELDDEDGLPF